MKYAELQKRLKLFKQAGLSSMKLNAKKIELEKEYQQCLQQDLSDIQLRRRIAHHQKIQNSVRESLSSLKARAYSIAGLNTVQELRQNYPQIRDKKLNFRTKKAWRECLSILETIHQETLECERFKAKIKSIIERYKDLRQALGENSSLAFQELLELKDIVSQYIPNLGSLTPQQQLMKTWLQKTLSTNNIQV